MSNSSLVSYKKISPNRTSPRNHDVDTITPHCYVGQATVQDMGAWLCNPSAQASANYGIGKDGAIGLFVEEKDRSWCSSNRDNDNRAITIECASDKTDPYAINAKVYASLINLMVDICKRYGKKKLLWFGDKAKTLAYTPKADEMLMTIHRWFASKSCPGDYIYARLPQIASEVTARLSGADTVTEPQKQTAKYMKGIPATKDAYIEECGRIAQELHKETKILPSVVVAQCCLETGFGLGSDSTVLMQVNNLLGMKTDLINGTWDKYSVWDGKSISKRTPEYYNGKLTYITDSFRAYTDYENCIRDYEMFLLHVQNNKGLKYARIAGMTDPAKVIHAIRVGTGTDAKPEGYCTDPAYETKIMSLIKEYNLTRFDSGAETSTSATSEKETSSTYRVQIGAYTKKNNATSRQKAVKAKTGFDCFVERGTDKMYRVYCGSFSVKTNAEKRVSDLKKSGVTGAFVATCR